MNKKKNPKFLFLTKLLSLVMLLSSIMNFSFFSTANAANYSYDTNLCYSSDLAYGLGIKSGKLCVNNTPLGSLKWERIFNFSYSGVSTYRCQNVQWSVSNISSAEKVQFGSYYSPYTGNINNAFKVRVQNVLYTYWYTHYESGYGTTERSQEDVNGLTTPRYTNTYSYDSNVEGPLYMIINADTGKVVDFYAPEYNFYYAMGIERASFTSKGSVYPITLGIPTNLKYSATDNSINVSWNSVATTTGYDLEVDGQVIDIGNTLSYTQNNLQPDSQHTYRIRAKNSTSTGNWSNILTARTLKSNQPPVLSAIGNQTVDEGQPLQFTLNATDPDGDTLTCTTSSPLPTGATFDPATKTFTWTPDYTQSGSYTVHFEVSDGQVIDSEDITITVNNVNLPPLLDAIGNQTVDEGQPLQFTLNATDPDGDTLTYTTSSPLPTGATFDPATKTFTWTPDYTQSGSYTVHFEVSDGQVIDSEDITITVNNVNLPPVLDAIGNQTVDEGQPLQFTLNATDPDGDTLTYTTSSPLPTGATFDPATKTFIWTPDYTQSGSYTVHFEVSDGQVIDSEDITITVNNVSADSLMLDALNFIESLNLPQGRENSIISSLNNAITTWQNGNYTAAPNKIDAIINKLEAMRGRTLTNEQADSAIEKMKEINSVIELQ